MEGRLTKALSGFYYVEDETGQVLECRARGRFRREGVNPLVGDRVTFTGTEEGKGVIEEILPRKNAFVRPPVANVDTMIVLASGVNPVSDPFLIDRITAIAEHNSAQAIICVNKSDLDRADTLYDIYTRAGFLTIHTSAVTGEGVDALREAIRGKTCAFVGNSGVGKSSILNALEPGFTLKTAAVSDKLGRGRHTTRHVELFPLTCGARVADTPGFSSFDTERMELVVKEDLQYAFPDFAPYRDSCRFRDCAHVGEKGCAVLEAVERGEIQPTRHQSYVRLYNHAKEIKAWEIKK